MLAVSADDWALQSTILRSFERLPASAASGYIQAAAPLTAAEQADLQPTLHPLRHEWTEATAATGGLGR
jgi:hypothetical protein